MCFRTTTWPSLEKQLERAKRLTDETGGGILVITEGVFGMSGNLGKLREIVELKEKYDFRLFVDDAHGFGTMGATGAGTAEHLGVQDGIDLYFLHLRQEHGQHRRLRGGAGKRD